MYRALIGSSLAAIAICAAIPAAAQQADGTASQPDDRVDNRANDPANDLDAAQTPQDRASGAPPRARLPELPEIEDDWRDLVDGDVDDLNDGDDLDTAADQDAAAPVDLRYTLDSEQVSGYGVNAEFRALSTLYEGRGKTVPSLAELQRRARIDTELLFRLLRSEGYYDPEIEIEIDPTADAAQLRVTVRVDPGPRYLLGDIAITLDDERQRGFVEEQLALTKNDPVVAQTFNSAVDRLKLGLGQIGYPFAVVDDPDILIDHDTRIAVYSLNIDLGDPARFGQIYVEGDPVFSAKHIGRLARFDPGDRYDTREVEDLRRAIVATGLVSSVSIVPEKQPAGADGTAPVDLAVMLTPAPARTLAGQVGYSTVDGIRVEASWQHRNLIRPQGQVTFGGVAGTQEQRLFADLRRSNWKQRDRTLGARVDASVEDRDAYYARTLALSGFIERETNIIWQKAWVYRFGAELLASEERDRSLRIAPQAAPLRTFLVAAVPLRISYDGSDDLLDPTRGFRLGAWISPEVSFQNSVFTYMRAQVDAAAYLPMMEDKLVIAGRGRLGTIYGAERSRIAPTRRFYAGGGGSVRGYGYQDVGPQDAEGDPLGGRSLMEFSLEARYRFGNFGIVPFIDAGQIDTRPYPRFRDLQFGAGIGARYYTNFGPIRIDVATPLNRQRGDSRIAVYVSIGQAF